MKEVNSQLLFDNKQWSTGLQIQGMSARKSASELEQYDLPAAAVVNYVLNVQVNKSIAIQCGVQYVTNTRHIVAARPADYRTFTPRIWTLGLAIDFQLMGR